MAPVKPPVNVPLNSGSKPDWNTRLGYPRLFNMFVGESGSIYCTPAMRAIASINNISAIRFTAFETGSYIVATPTSILRVSLNGAISFIASIVASGQPIQMAENLRNQIGIADGRFGYVFDQAANTFTLLTEGAHNFAIANPISLVVLNSFMVWLGENGRWQPSNPNNALAYDPLAVKEIDSSLTSAKCISTLYNNLYIFGSTGIERWEATLQTNIYLFPFQKDNNFRRDFGALSTSCVVNAINKIYFLSSLYVPMALTPQGEVILPEQQAMTGFARIISQFPDKEKTMGSFYSFRGNFFFQMTFEQEGVAWVYNQNSNTIAEVDDLIVGTAYPFKNETVIKRDGVYELTLDQATKNREFRSDRVVSYKGQQNVRNLLNGIEIRIVQGFPQVIEPQFLDLSLSRDSQSWMNVVRIPMGETGRRNALSIWRSNVGFQYEITTKIQYYGSYNFVIEKETLIIN